MSLPDRLVLVGGILVDVVLVVPALPERGGDVLATDSLLTTGAGFNVLSAARRQGMAAAYLGLHGTGDFADRIRADLVREGIEVLLPRTDEGDSGFCIGLVDAGGERTYATRYGVEGHLTTADVHAAPLRPTDLVYLSGYELTYAHAAVVGRWFAALPTEHVSVFDPGPLVGEIPRDLLEPVLSRADWISLNAREAGILTGTASAHSAVAAWPARFGVPAGGVIVRDGARGCSVITADGATRVPVAEPHAHPVDTSGAGDTHVGAFLAALARGESAHAAAAAANAAAAWCVTRFGPANAPTLAELAAARRGSGTGS